MRRVMVGPVPSTSFVFRKKKDVDHRVKPGDDSFLWRLKKQLHPSQFNERRR
jgi:hypothetical protein